MVRARVREAYADEAVVCIATGSTGLLQSIWVHRDTIVRLDRPREARDGGSPVLDAAGAT